MHRHYVVAPCRDQNQQRTLKLWQPQRTIWVTQGLVATFEVRLEPLLSLLSSIERARKESHSEGPIEITPLLLAFTSYAPMSCPTPPHVPMVDRRQTANAVENGQFDEGWMVVAEWWYVSPSTGAP